MFYLIEFLKAMKTHFFSVAICLLMGTGLIWGSFHHSEWDKKIRKISQASKANPYFNALVDTKSSFEKIRRKMKQLPGVLNVITSGKLRVDSEISQLRKTFGDDALPGIDHLKFNRIKVEMSHGLGKKNQQLIQEYLTRLVGKESITIGSLKKPGQGHDKVALLSLVNAWGVPLIFGTMLVLWCISFFHLAYNTKKKFFVIENFQRKKLVSVKTLIGFQVGYWVLLFAFLVLMSGQFSLPTLFAITILVGLGCGILSLCGAWKQSI